MDQLNAVSKIPMGEKILIVEDEFLEANNLRIILEKSEHRICGVARNVERAKVLIQQENPNIVLIDIFLKGNLTGIDLARWLAQIGIPFIFLSANSNESTLTAAKATQPYGFLVKPFRERDLLVALEIAVFRHKQIFEMRVRQEKWLSNLLQNISNRGGGKDQQLLLLAKAFQPFIKFDYILIDTDPKIGSESTLYGFQRIDYDDYKNLDMIQFFDQAGISFEEVLIIRKRAKDHDCFSYKNGTDFTEGCANDKVKNEFRNNYGVNSSMVVPVNAGKNASGIITFLSKYPENFSDDHLELIGSVIPQLLSIILKISHAPLINQAEQLPGSNNVVFLEPNFPGIVGKSSALLSVLDQIRQVAPYDTSVLILGETGTGKEALVDAIHLLSSRKSKPLIKINCAAIPAALVESELFGHERGSYTDARERKIGKFELAQGGTIFLDEIGEMPLDVQTKLLRVLQEKEIERVGGRSTIKVDVRVIAATNRDLYKEVGTGNFRMDLYYRINVFPIIVPPLRDRKEDIPLLVDYFLCQFSKLHGTDLKSVTWQVTKKLITYRWPGNIRELRHLIERYTLMTHGTVISAVDLPDELTLHVDAVEKNCFEPKSIEEVERNHILMVLQQCNGRIAGKGGAAEILRIPPSTLNLKMKKLRISWRHTIN